MTTNELIYWLNRLEDRGLFRAILIIVTFLGSIFGFSMVGLWFLLKH